MKIKSTITLVFIIILLLVGCKQQTNTDWAIHFVVWNENIYEIKKDKKVEVEKEIGSVEKHIEKEDNYEGTFSNLLIEGSKLYKIKGKNTNESIGVELEGEYVEAEYDGKYGE